MAGNYGTTERGPIVLYDDDGYYLGSVLAEKLAADGFKVHLLTPTGEVAPWTNHTLEHGRIAARLAKLGSEYLTPARPWRWFVRRNRGEVGRQQPGDAARNLAARPGHFAAIPTMRSTSTSPPTSLALPPPASPR